jgi:hypothetical protein
MGIMNADWMCLFLVTMLAFLYDSLQMPGSALLQSSALSSCISTITAAHLVFCSFHAGLWLARGWYRGLHAMQTFTYVFSTMDG